MNIASELVRMAVKTKGLKREEWPATRITQAAKQLLDAQGENGRIITIVRQQVEAERANLSVTSDNLWEVRGANSSSY